MRRGEGQNCGSREEEALSPGHGEGGVCERGGEVRDERQLLVWVTGRTQSLKTKTERMNGSRKEEELARGYVLETSARPAERNC